ncbi:hypothetical protein L211DRAFT_361033 [Terfezia boudieri ATCC MYA-4762]|uniref:Uncharacterized protein n=1 Tax=Terfezia boudieri ATCC MYA-4762 TaxID=1051890 RepID=A0A3N4LK24_9PEZI|nr:hypothetical protein L211DRAFT_361033 [Terfezia boudieri ATCC MYA-4762]
MYAAYGCASVLGVLCRVSDVCSSSGLRYLGIWLGMLHLVVLVRNQPIGSEVWLGLRIVLGCDKSLHDVYFSKVSVLSDVFSPFLNPLHPLQQPGP